ncbi:hypothetical protein V6Z12_A06G107900 [Gossypium hirsutum]
MDCYFDSGLFDDLFCFLIFKTANKRERKASPPPLLHSFSFGFIADYMLLPLLSACFAFALHVSLFLSCLPLFIRRCGGASDGSVRQYGQRMVSGRGGSGLAARVGAEWETRSVAVAQSEAKWD